MPVPEETRAPDDLLIRAIEARDGAAFLEISGDTHYADLASAYENLSRDEDRKFFIRSLNSELLSDVLPDLPESLVEEALDHLKPSQQREILEAAEDDDRVDILQDVSEKKQEELLSLLPSGEEERTRTLLEFEEDTAGGRMTTRSARLSVDLSVREALDHLRDRLEDTETFSRIFLIDDDGRLIGKVRLRDLAFNSWDTPLREIMQPVEHSILASADQEEAVALFTKYDLIALPVVDDSNRFLGVITHDDAMEILEEESTEDLEKIAGISGDQREETYLNTSVLSDFRRRFGWLLVLAFFAISSGYVMIKFESVLSNVFLLALFLPMVIAAGGNTGGQAATLVIRSMALGELDIADLRRVAWKELRLGLLLGATLGLCIAATAIFIVPQFQPDVPANFNYYRFGLAVSLALATQIVTSTLIGSLLPLGAKSIKLDPAVIAHPAITTIVDVSGMIIYFTVANGLMEI